jgi:sortase A
LGIIEVPSMGLDKTLVNGISIDNLRDGPGHFPESAIPGQLGNTAIAGHRTTFGAPFFRIDEVEPGDQIVITTLAGRFVYIATETVIVGADDYAEVVPTRDPEQATISLISCHPRYTSRDRIVVRGVLDSTLSTPIVAATTTTVAPSTTAPPSTLPDEPAASIPDTVPDTVPPTTSPAEPGADTFASGWFNDQDAFAQVALWGTICSLIALGAWGLSRWTRRNWVGALVGIVPFVVALYFFFQNVNRLLPAGL